MRTVVLSFIALFLLVGPSEVRASETASDEPTAEITSRFSTADAPSAGELQLTKVQQSERATDSDAAAAQFAPRGSFWWVVGVIVVAGVILAVVL